MGLIPKSEFENKIIDFSDARAFKSIKDKNKFLAWLIVYVPSGSIWHIEGIWSEEVFHTIRDYLTADCFQTYKWFAKPRLKYIKVLLEDQSKKAVCEKIDGWDLDSELIHQHIYFGDHVYLTSYDNLHENCTWVSDKIETAELNRLEEEGIIEQF